MYTMRGAIESFSKETIHYLHIHPTPSRESLFLLLVAKITLLIGSNLTNDEYSDPIHMYEVYSFFMKDKDAKPFGQFPNLI